MNKNEREKTWKSISKENQASNNKMFEDDINNLNENESFSPIDEVEKKVPLTEVEKKVVQIKIFFLLIAVIVFVIGLIAFRIITSQTKTAITSQTETPSQDEVNEESEIQDNEIVDKSTPITELKDGEISADNNELSILVNEIKYENGEKYLPVAKGIYINENTDIKLLSDECKLFLVSKTKEFEKIASENVLVNLYTQNSAQLEIKEIDTILKARLNTSLDKHKEFIYLLVFENNELSVVKFSKNGNFYNATIEREVKVSSSRIEQKFISASKQKNKIYVDMKVVFIKENGIYKDSNYKSLITKEPQKTEDDWFKEANTYRHTYEIINNNYVLTNVSLIK